MCVQRPPSDTYTLPAILINTSTMYKLLGNHSHSSHKWRKKTWNIRFLHTESPMETRGRWDETTHFLAINWEFSTDSTHPAGSQWKTRYLHRFRSDFRPIRARNCVVLFPGCGLQTSRPVCSGSRQNTDWLAPFITIVSSRYRPFFFIDEVSLFN